MPVINIRPDFLPSLGFDLVISSTRQPFPFDIVL
jgi:hypothetical protein